LESQLNKLLELCEGDKCKEDRRLEEIRAHARRVKSAFDWIDNFAVTRVPDKTVS